MTEVKTEYILPKKLIMAEGDIECAENLFRAGFLQIGLGEDRYCTVKGKGYMILDFGREYAGGVRIFTFLTSLSCPVRVRFGESLAECCAELGYKGACNDHSLRDITTELVSYQDVTLGQTGFRFVRIDFLGEGEVKIKNVYCAYSRRDFFSEKPFRCADARLNEIFYTAKRTVDLCCQSMLWDGIKRDRLVWIGDMHPEMLAVTSMYGRAEVIEASIDFAISQHPVGEWMNGIPMYSTWVPIILADYYCVEGGQPLVEFHKEYLKGVVEQINACVKADGELDMPRYFVDWPTHEQVDELAGCRALITVMANKCLELFSKIGLDTSAVEELKKKILLKPIEVQKAKQVLALKFWATGELRADEVEKLTCGGAKGMSTFMSYYILKAVAQTAGRDVAVDMLKEYYGGMLDMGATTFFEDFDIEWMENSCRIDELPKEGQRDIHGDFGKYCYKGFRHSLCHGWSGGVIKFLYEYCNS